MKKELYDKDFIGDFLEWILENCDMEKGSNPYDGDDWQNYFYYKGDQMYGYYELLNKYLETLK